MNSADNPGASSKSAAAPSAISQKKTNASTHSKPDADVIVIGGGAAGLMCAYSAAQRGRKVQVLDHANRLGKKILMSGGGRCNFTNLDVTPENFLSQNAHYCKSALSRYTQWDFIDWVEQSKIPYHEKKLGQLFCDHKASDILQMLLQACEDSGVQLETHCSINEISKRDQHYVLNTSSGIKTTPSLVIATGGLSIPTMGASPFGYRIAEQFGHSLIPQNAALVPFTLDKPLLEKFSVLSGLSLDIEVSCNNTSFKEALLFTHRGLSGPAILQISSYWQPGMTVTIDLLPELDLESYLKEKKDSSPNKQLKTFLQQLLPKKLAQLISELWFEDKAIGRYSHKELSTIAHAIKAWQFKPSGTEGYRTAEVTLGGVNTDELSSKTMESKLSKDLYFIGEVVDVSGHLGGFNFQWAWSSGYAAAQFV